MVYGSIVEARLFQLDRSWIRAILAD